MEEYIESTWANIIIATDGSIRDNSTKWGGAVWQDRERVYSWCAGKHGRTSSYRAESEAFENALTWMAAKIGQNDHVLVLTGSQSLVTQLQLGNVKETRVAPLDYIKGSFKIAYIPGHAGISYNDAADHLAGIAVPIGVIKFHRQDHR